MRNKNVRYSEIFGNTIQGEGYHTGVMTTWIRLFGCNLSCEGFGQENPLDPETYKQPYSEVIDPKSITNINDLPVFEVGCDSGYSWSQTFRHLALRDTTDALAQKITDLNKSKYNPEGLWRHPLTDQEIHMCFTGGEPMMQQDVITEILDEMIKTNNYPKYVTIETNGTQALRETFSEWWLDHPEIELTFSISPKLQSVSGEVMSKAWRPAVIESYLDLTLKINGLAYTKFVVNRLSYNELKYNIQELKNIKERLQKEYGVSDMDFRIYAMPVGGTLEGQEAHPTEFYDELIAMGLHISDRVHVRIYGNVVGK